MRLMTLSGPTLYDAQYFLRLKTLWGPRLYEAQNFMRPKLYETHGIMLAGLP